MHERVQRFGGQIAVMPRSGGGTVVTITMPFSESGAPEWLR
jgi:signal transduction histidine kinase